MSVLRASSRPSRIQRVRSARAATSAPCVITSKRQTLLAMEPIEEIEHAAAGRRIEIPRRLVGQEQQRIVGERPGDGDSLPFADGELRRKMPRPVRHADQRQQFLGLADAFAAAARSLEHGDLHVFERGERRQEMERLEDETQRLGAKAVEVLACGERLALEINLAARRAVEGSQAG